MRRTEHSHRMQEDEVSFLLEQDRWRRVRGFNYQPSYAYSATELWLDRFDPATIDRELRLGRQQFPGINAVRLWLSHDPFFRNPAAFARNLETALDLCDQHGLQAIVTLFNHWHSIPDFGGIALEMIHYWFASYGQRGHAADYIFGPYLEATVGAHARDPRILAWDLCNEPHLDPKGVLRDWLQHTYEAAKRLEAQAPVGVSVNVDLDLLAAVEPCSDVLMIHPYHAGQVDWSALHALAREHGKALLATECCWGSLDDAERVRIIRRDLGTLTQQGIGFLAHALCESRVADLHRPDWGPVSGAGYMAFLHRDGTLRAGHEAFNDYPPQAVEAETLEAAQAWLEQRAHEMIRSSRRTMDDGRAAFPPQVGSHYDAFWLRDYAYMLEGRPASFTPEEMRDACFLFVDALRDDGSGVDCVAFDGRPIYKPGYGTMGEHPVADGSQFTVDVAWHTYRHTGDHDLVRRIVDRLQACLHAVPRDPANGLVFIDPHREWDRCPYGFTDQVRKQGDVLFCSLLFVQACRQLADLLAVAGRPFETIAWQAEAARVAAEIRGVFWHPESGLFHAATSQCDQPDIWGSAFAVYLDVASPDQALEVAHVFRDGYAGIVDRGQLRHLPGGTYWEELDAYRDRYQNGGYWGTPVGWFIYTLDLIDPELADRTFVDMVQDYRLRGVYENIFAEEQYVPQYNASAALPLAGLRALRQRRRQPS